MALFSFQSITAAQAGSYSAATDSLATITAESLLPILRDYVSDTSPSRSRRWAHARGSS